MTVICVASSKAPREQQKSDFLDDVRRLARSCGCELVAYLGREGPGCYNHGFRVRGERWREFADIVTVILGPISRWCTSAEEFHYFTFEDL